MIHANQRSLMQQTNLGLINIRQQELNYYNNFYSQFGGQAAIIGGFTYGALTQGNIFYGFPDSPNVHAALLYCWWIPCTICILSAVHVIFTTILLQILGPGLALTGPIGSMARANKGLHAEMVQVFTAYMIMLISFAFSVLAALWLMMDWPCSAACSLVFFYSLRIWWWYGIRIYNRFYEEAFITGERTVEFDTQTDKAAKGLSDTGGIVGAGGSDDSKSSGGDIPLGAIKRGAEFDGGGRPSISSSLSSFFGMKRKSKAKKNAFTEGYTEFGNGVQPSVAVGNPLAGGAVPVLCEGYLTKKGSKEDNEKDERDYTVLTTRGSLLFYTSRSEHLHRGEEGIKYRPLDVRLYRLQVITNANLSDVASDTMSLAGRKLATQQLLFELRLIPADSQNRMRTWVMRCDTEHELDSWVGGLTKFATLVN